MYDKHTEVQHGPTRVEPLDVLKQRYAAGEISAAEYEQARHVIE